MSESRFKNFAKKSFNKVNLLGWFALKNFDKVNKSISDTERAVLKSGTVGYEASLFSGKPDWKGLFATPAPTLTAEEQSFLDNEVEQLCAMVDDWKIRDELNDLPKEVWDFLKEKKFFAMIIPKEYGGLGFSARAHSKVVAKIGSRSSAVAATTMVPNSLGPAELLSRYGTKEQKDHYLPRLATGAEIPCFSLTSPTAGSDATGLKDEGTVFKGEDGKLYLRLNWEKRYITLAPIATLFGLAFQLKDPEGLLGGAKDRGITLALVPADTPGIHRGLRHRPGASPFMNGPHYGKDVVVPLDSVIGGEKFVGKGWNMLVECLSVGRAISLPASSAGAAQMVTRASGAYAVARKQFGFPLSKMQGVQEALARMGGLTYMIDAARTLPLQDLDLAHAAGKDALPAISSAILKYHTTEAARQVAIDGMDIFAGKGVCDGPTNPVGPAYQGIPVGITVEGANILTRNMIIFGQSAFLAHPYTLKELDASDRKDKGAAGMLLLKHTFNIASNAVKSVFMGVTNGMGSSAPHKGADKKYYQQINRLASGFTFAANTAMLILQAGLKREQRTSALLGDAYSNLYLASQVLRRWNLEGRKDEDRPLMQWAVQNCLYKAENALHEMTTNFPIKPVGMMLKAALFPMGRRLEKPSHRLDAKVAEIVTTPGAARDRLTGDMYHPKAAGEYLNKLERAMELASKSLPSEQAIAKAVRKGVITADSDNFEAVLAEAIEKQVVTTEAAQLVRDAEAIRADVITVDSFAKEWKGPAVGLHAPTAP